MDILRYPIGQFVPDHHPSMEDRQQLINEIPKLTQSLKIEVLTLSPAQLKLTYRSGSWNIQQIVHHMADNDMNAYLRLKRALTEEQPEASSYREDLWAELSDYKDVPVTTSISLLEALHSRFHLLLQKLVPEDFNRAFTTQALGLITVDVAIQRFVWHNLHHIAQIRLASSGQRGDIL